MIHGQKNIESENRSSIISGVEDILYGFVHFRSLGPPNIMSNCACALHREVKLSGHALDHSRAMYSQRLRYSGAILTLSFT